jgi:hypothetical protein
MDKKNKKATMEEEIKTIQRHVGGLVKNMLNLQSKVEAIEKKLEDKFIDEVNAILVKQRDLDKAIVANSAAILEIEKDILNSSKVKPSETQEDTSKDKTSDKAIVIKRKKCRYFNRGYCKYKDKCRYTHPKNICTEHLQSMKCETRDCLGRHPKTCKWWSKQDGCKRGSECGYLHVMSENKTEANSEKFKCISCKHIWEDRSCVMEHFIGNMRMFFCLNCDDWVHDKQKVLEHGWTLFDEAGNLRMDL